MTVNKISFTGYNSILKTKWRQGLLPSVKKGFYGDDLTQDNLSVEHLELHCKGGPTTLDNTVLASKNQNNKRGCKDLNKVIDIAKAKQYLLQFVGVNDEGFDGDIYVKNIIKRLKKLDVLI